jgi:phosphoribosylformylglycinamidine synthase
MGLVLRHKDVDRLEKIAERERAPMYVVGRTTGNMNFTFSHKNGVKPIDWKLSDMFGNPPKTVMKDETVSHKYSAVAYDVNKIAEYVRAVMQLESVGCKDWLTNKVDRSVTGKVAKQQCAGKLQLPLNDLGAVALDYNGVKGMATSIGHAPAVGLIDASAGSVMSAAEALTNLVFAPLTYGLKGVSLSANWMWPCRQKGEDARLYAAVKAMSDWVTSLGINIPTGKDSLSMTQKYSDGRTVLSPGTVIISAMGEVSDIRKIVEPVIKNDESTSLIHIDMSGMEPEIGGSALAQVLGKLGDKAPTVADTELFVRAFEAIQKLINEGLVVAGHDVSAGGIVTTLLEMTYSNTEGGIVADFSTAGRDAVLNLFAENPGVVLQVRDLNKVKSVLDKANVGFTYVGRPQKERKLSISAGGDATVEIDIDEMRDVWFETSANLDALQSGKTKAAERKANYKKQPLDLKLPANWTGKLKDLGLQLSRHGKTGVRAAIIREKGVNGDREMAYSLYLAGFDVKDVHMTDLVSGRETLEDVNMIVFCGGFSNSDVLGSAKGWAGAFLYNERARKALDNFYARPDTLSLGVCNGCQLVIELGLLHRSAEEVSLRPKMLHNDSHKFESSYLSVEIPENNSVMFGSLAGSRLGIWVAHGEGKFSLPAGADKYNVVAKYAYSGYPANPNGSAADIAGMASADGRHVAIMPHLERAIFPWQCAYYPDENKADELTPWIVSLVNARKWIQQNKK